MYPSVADMIAAAAVGDDKCPRTASGQVQDLDVAIVANLRSAAEPWRA